MKTTNLAVAFNAGLITVNQEFTLDCQSKNKSALFDFRHCIVFEIGSDYIRMFDTNNMPFTVFTEKSGDKINFYSCGASMSEFEIIEEPAGGENQKQFYLLILVFALISKSTKNKQQHLTLKKQYPHSYNKPNTGERHD